jgi:hypothetical protein
MRRICSFSDVPSDSDDLIAEAGIDAGDEERGYSL